MCIDWCCCCFFSRALKLLAIKLNLSISFHFINLQLQSRFLKLIFPSRLRSLCCVLSECDAWDIFFLSGVSVYASCCSLDKTLGPVNGWRLFREIKRNSSSPGKGHDFWKRNTRSINFYRSVWLGFISCVRWGKQECDAVPEQEENTFEGAAWRIVAYHPCLLKSCV